MTQLYVSRGQYTGYETITKTGANYVLDADLDANGNNIMMGGGLFDTEGGNILLGGGDISEIDDIFFNVNAAREIRQNAGSMQLRMETGSVLDVVINSVTEYTFAATTLDLGGNILSEVALIQGLTTTNKLDDTTSGWIIDGPTSCRIAILGVNQVQIADGIISFADCYVDMQEQTAPAAPAANNGRLYMKDNGSGKTQYVVKFNTGAEQVIATQP